VAALPTVASFAAIRFHSTPGSKVIKKKKKSSFFPVFYFKFCRAGFGAETVWGSESTTPTLLDTMYLSTSFRESTHPQNSQLNILISNIKNESTILWGR